MDGRQLNVCVARGAAAGRLLLRIPILHLECERLQRGPRLNINFYRFRFRVALFSPLAPRPIGFVFILQLLSPLITILIESEMRRPRRPRRPERSANKNKHIVCDTFEWAIRAERLERIPRTKGRNVSLSSPVELIAFLFCCSCPFLSKLSFVKRYLF